MIRGVYNRLFGSYKEGALLVGKWNIGASGAVTAQAETHNDLILTRSTTGTYTLSVRNGVQNLTVVALNYVGKTAPTVVADLRTLSLNTATVPGTTGIGFVVGDGVANTIEEATNGDEIHAVVYVNR